MHRNYYKVVSPSGVVWERQWQCSKEEMDDYVKNRDIFFGYPPEYNHTPRLKVRPGKEIEIIPENIIDGVGTTKSAVTELKKIFLHNLFDYPKPVGLIKHLISLLSKKDLIVLDFFAGSGTTGHAVMELNEEDGGSRKFILVTNNENNIATEVTWERLFRVINGVGSNGEKIDWKYSKKKASLTNNEVRTFDIKYHELKLNDFDKAKELIPIAENQFKLLNENYKPKGKFDIYNELSSLNPYKKN